jgi:hypothetical protein
VLPTIAASMRLYTRPYADIGQALDSLGRVRAKPLKLLALPSGIEPLSPP